MRRHVSALGVFVAAWTCTFAVALYVSVGTPYRPWAVLAAFLGMVASGLYWARKTSTRPSK